MSILIIITLAWLAWLAWPSWHPDRPCPWRIREGSNL
jgi:hypothetical protein